MLRCGHFWKMDVIWSSSFPVQNILFFYSFLFGEEYPHLSCYSQWFSRCSFGLSSGVKRFTLWYFHNFERKNFIHSSWVDLLLLFPTCNDIRLKISTISKQINSTHIRIYFYYQNIFKFINTPFLQKKTDDDDEVCLFFHQSTPTKH